MFRQLRHATSFRDLNHEIHCKCQRKPMVDSLNSRPALCYLAMIQRIKLTVRNASEGPKIQQTPEAIKVDRSLFL
jgi:hypothetical protein